MKIATLCYRTIQGLGLLAKSFVDHGVVTHPIAVRHGRREEQPWYPGCYEVTNVRDAGQIEKVKEILREMDAVLFFETAFAWELLPFCRSVGVKTVLMPMMECSPSPLPELPDLILCPSLLDQQYYPGLVGGMGEQGVKSVFLPVPVDVPWRQRERAEVFIHNGGHGGLKGRNGTAELLAAMRHVRSPVRLIVRSQRGTMSGFDSKIVAEDSRIEWREGTVPYETLWEEGDVLVFPERFNGLSLPLQEARAAGLLVMCGDRFPMNTWLPHEPLIPIRRTIRDRVSPRCREFDSAVYDPKDIAAKIDRVYGTDISAYSESGRRWAEEMSWEKLGPKYLEVLAP